MSGGTGAGCGCAQTIARQWSHSQPWASVCTSGAPRKSSTAVGWSPVLLAGEFAARRGGRGAVVLSCVRDGDLEVTLRKFLLGRHRLFGATRSEDPLRSTDLATAADIAPPKRDFVAARQRGRCE